MNYLSLGKLGYNKDVDTEDQFHQKTFTFCRYAATSLCLNQVSAVAVEKVDSPRTVLVFSAAKKRQ